MKLLIGKHDDPEPAEEEEPDVVSEQLDEVIGQLEKVLVTLKELTKKKIEEAKPKEPKQYG